MQRENKTALAAFGITVLMIACTVTPAAAQKPSIFNVSNVVVGAQRIETTFFLAAGKWSDSGVKEGLDSTEIHCYKRLGFCEVASTYPGDNTGLTEYDILRWNKQEMVAEDNSPICVVSILRADFVKKTVTLSSTDKGVRKDPFCAGADKMPTAFLLGPDDVLKARRQKKKR